jgi:plastocyanin
VLPHDRPSPAFLPKSAGAGEGGAAPLANAKATEIFMRRSILFSALLATFAGGAATAQTAPQTLTVEMSNFKFTPATLTLVRGRPYVLHFVNSASGGHDFVAKDFFAGATIAPEDRAKVRNGEVELSGGESADVHLVANTAGTFKSHCSHFMHSSFGMTGTVVVQ